MTSLLQKIALKTVRIVVMGVGYAGLPLVAAFAKAGFRVTGLDKDESRVLRLARGESTIDDLSSAELLPYVQSGVLTATCDASVLREADVVIVCVPTPLSKTREPDIQFIVEATEEVARHQHSNMLVVLESTTYPGTTTEVLVPKLSGQDYVLGEDVFVAFSPERVDPGNVVHKTKNTPKVIGGATEACLECATSLYSSIIDSIVPVSSTETAETVKLLENTFRAVNIGLINEVAMMSRKLGVDPFEVIRAAATKPFGFMPFYPGPGLGGHCVPIDPLYLSWRLKSLKYEARFIALADSINSGMPAYVVQRLADCLNELCKSVKGSKILLYGVAYKANVGDLRESPALGVILELKKRGAEISYMDPYIPRVKEGGLHLDAIDESEDFGNFDAVLIVTDHEALPAERMLSQAPLILDTRGALSGLQAGGATVHGL